MIHGAASHAAIEATMRTTSEPVITLEIDFQARRSPSRARRSTNTGMNVALAMPPSTRSNNILGTVFARLKASAIGENPRTHASTRTLKRPVRREARVPVAIEKTREPCDWLSLIVRGVPWTCVGTCGSTSRRARGVTRGSRGSQRLNCRRCEPESPLGRAPAVRWAS